MDAACPLCENEEANGLGCLGRVVHYRCRCCGWQWSDSVEDDADDDRFAEA